MNDSSADGLHQKYRDVRMKLKREHRHMSKKLAKQQQELEEAKRWRWYQQIGDSLLARPEEYPRGTASCAIENIHSGEPESARLNPKLDAYGNAELLYKKARKGRRGEEVAAQKAYDTRTALEEIENLMQKCNEAGELEPKAAEFERAAAIIIQEAASLISGNSGAQAKSEKEKRPRTPYRYFCIEGFDVYIGKNDTQNDELSTRFVRPWDNWLHVVAHTGSHVVIRREKHGGSPPKAVLEKAAALAVWFSKARYTSFAEVHVTEGRYVRKPRRSPPGRVIAERCKTVRVAPISPQQMFPDYRQYHE